MRWIGTASLVVLLAASASAGELVKMYTYTELLAAEGGESRAYAINDTGQVIGWMASGDDLHSAYWHNNSAVDLHTGTVHFGMAHPLFDQPYSEAYDISNGGQIIGTARTEIECPPTFVITTAFILRPAVQTDLATPYPGDALANLWTLGSPCETAYDSVATGISNRNYIVGWADRTDGTTHGFLVRPVAGQFFADLDADLVNDFMIDLGTLAASDPVSSATAVNDLGQVTGYSYTTAQNGQAAYHAFLVTPMDANLDGDPDTWFSGVNGVNTLMTDLGTLGGLNSWGRDVSDDGLVVGESDYTHPDGEHYTRAFIWQNGVMTDLGTLRSDRSKGFSAASAINSSGVVVGWAENEDRQKRAFVYEDGVMTDLNTALYLVDENGVAVTSRLTLTEARDINADGSIVGWGTIGTSATAERRGFLLTPVMVDPDTILQPGDVADNEPPPDSSSDGTDGNTPDNTSDSGTTPTGGSYIDGTPGNVNGEASDPADDGGDATPAPSPGVFCGPSTLMALPLTIAGLLMMRRPRRIVKR